jgi:hypothetical protein
VTRRLSRRDVLTKSLGIEFKSASCPCHTTTAYPRVTSLKCACSSKPRTPDPALVKAVKRFQAFVECTKEPHGALAWDVAECSARWMSNGLVQEGPAVKWFDPDGRRAGYWRPGDDAIHLSRGLSWREVIRVCAHEAAGHWWHNWDPSEETAKLAERYIERRYLERLNAA